MVGLTKKLICRQASLRWRGFGGAAGPRINKLNARMVNGGVQFDSHYAWWVSKTSHRLSSKLAHGSKQGGGLGGPNPPNVRMVGFQKKTHMLSSKLAQAGGWRGAAPLFANILLAGEWRGFKRLLLCRLGKKKNFSKCTAAGSTAQGRRPATLPLEPADQDKT